MPSAPTSEDVPSRDAPGSNFLLRVPSSSSEAGGDLLRGALARDEGALDRGRVAVVTADEDSVAEVDRAAALQRWGPRRQGGPDAVPRHDPPPRGVTAVDLAHVAQDGLLGGVTVGPVEQAGGLDEVP